LHGDQKKARQRLQAKVADLHICKVGIGAPGRKNDGQKEEYLGARQNVPGIRDTSEY
jgi:hypothetical protein